MVGFPKGDIRVARGLDGLRSVEEHRPDLIVLDAMRPEVLFEIRAMRGRALQVIYHYVRALELWKRPLRVAPTPELREQIKQYLVNLQ